MCVLLIDSRWLGRKYSDLGRSVVNCLLVSRPQRFLISLAILISFSSAASAQVGVGNGQANSLLSCIATAAGTPELRPEGYTELTGGTYPQINVTVNVSSNAAPLLTNVASVSGGGSATNPTASDPTNIIPVTCKVTGDATPSVAHVRSLINGALGLSPVAFDLNGDQSVNIADIQIAVAAVASVRLRRINQ